MWAVENNAKNEILWFPSSAVWLWNMVLPSKYSKQGVICYLKAIIQLHTKGKGLVGKSLLEKYYKPQTWGENCQNVNFEG
jgi:hypothetical protein